MSKPIRPTIVYLDEMEYNNFFDLDINDTKTDTEQMNKLRELLKNHKESKKES
ncbi:hypothetical protein [Paenibacillus lactis]|uniref:hypothetical protein n=1 Tax=Paenibacillus lactis TaxID=228574 RepID=UPI003D70E665